MGIIIGAVGLGLLLWIASKGGIPKDAEPDRPEVKKLKPIQTRQTINGRTYDTWQYPRVEPLGHYYIVASDNKGKRVWMSFFYLPEKNTRIPQKTNVGDLGLTPNDSAALLSVLKTDWGFTS